MNFKTFALATVAAVGVTGAASAATLTIDGGSAVILNDPTNDAIFGPTAILAPGGTAFDGGKVRLNGSSVLRFTFHGREAAFNNVFEAYGGSFTNSSVGSNAFSLSGFASFETAGEVTGGLIDFLFRINGGPTVVTNAGNNSSSPNFLVSALEDGSLLMWLDDKGADPEDNHDDMLVRVEVVPVPAAGLLLLGGIGALAAMKRRRKTA
jgi:hypothetical protein